jgi:hypothetical protein
VIRERLHSLGRLEPVDNVFKAWHRLPERIRGSIPILVVVTLAAAYPYYVSSLPTDVPVILAFPDVGAGVTILVFVVMAVGLNVVVGYAGLLDLGYVAFYAIGAYTAGWLASGQFEQVRFHFGSVGISREAQGIHISVWLVLLCAGIITALGGILIGLPTLRLRGDYLAIVTLGFGEIIPQFVRNADSLHGFDLTPGIRRRPEQRGRPPGVVRAIVRPGAPLLLGRARHSAHHRLLLLPPARLAARARLDRHQRG